MVPRFNRYADWLMERYGCRVRRVPVDADLGCPHRHGVSGHTVGGCTFCDGSGVRAPVLGDIKSIIDQVRTVLAFMKARYAADRFMLYFQTHTSTNATVDKLAALYDSTLALDDFSGLIVSTRPDCLDDGRAELLASYRHKGLDVLVELGLQSSNDLTLARIRRGHSAENFRTARQLLQALDIPVAAHVIFGLPGEGLDDTAATARFLAGLDIEGVKIHDLHYCAGTPILHEAFGGELPLWPRAMHLEACIQFLELLPPSTHIMRLCTDTPPAIRVLPLRQIEKSAFYRDLQNEMARRNTWQGRLFTLAHQLE
jgi:hypothetical protein